MSGGYIGSLLTDGEYLQPEESNTTFNISAVNIEDNGNREPIHYVLPDGIIRNQFSDCKPCSAK